MAIISANPIRCPSSTMSRAPASRNSSARWKIGVRSSPSSASCSTIRRSPARPRGSRSTRRKRMRSRTNGSAISSPWHGGTISGSTKASRAGWRPRRPTISTPTGSRCSTASAGAKMRWGSTPSRRRTRSSRRSAPSRTPTRRSTRSPIKRARPSSRCSNPMRARMCGARVCAPIWPSINMRTRAPTICGTRLRPRAPRG